MTRLLDIYSSKSVNLDIIQTPFLQDYEIRGTCSKIPFFRGLYWSYSFEILD
jgi:hypothetical protein